MKKGVIFVLLDDFADWEGAFLAVALNGGVMPDHPSVYNRFNKHSFYKD